MKYIYRLLILSLLYIPTNAMGGEIIRIKKVKKQNRDRYEYNVTYLEAGSQSLKAKLLARKYGGNVESERSEDGLQVRLIKQNR